MKNTHQVTPARRKVRLWQTALEGPRAMMEAAVSTWSWPLLGTAPKGDGHPVLLVPGFMAPESTMMPLKAFLSNRGYAVESWGFGRNVGFQAKHAAALERKLEYMRHQHGRKVSMVGWSLGGVFGLYASHRAPDCVRSLITLGSPVTPGAEGHGAAPSVIALYRAVAHRLGPDAHMLQPHVREALSHSPAHPMSCLWSHSDGVVPPMEAQVADGSPVHENILVPGSHCGLAFNALVLWIIAERLSQPEENWQPFAPTGMPGATYRALSVF
ncbi:alpha/beta hydrolase [Variovorax rhizosphaerae]|uniref:Alpha/beta hydrolase n=1 Tax=Variovorax rhizosphaerae TaxID=1836200 RepID=A0ABU8WL52_9BURK